MEVGRERREKREKKGKERRKGKKERRKEGKRKRKKGEKKRIPFGFVSGYSKTTINRMPLSINPRFLSVISFTITASCARQSTSYKS